MPGLMPGLTNFTPHIDMLDECIDIARDAFKGMLKNGLLRVKRLLKMRPPDSVLNQSVFFATRSHHAFMMKGQRSKAYRKLMARPALAAENLRSLICPSLPLQWHN